MLLVPFDAVRRTIATSGIVFSEPSTYINLLKNSEFWQIVFNILLLVPFRSLFKILFQKTMVAGTHIFVPLQPVL